MEAGAFKKEIWRHYRENGRDLPWRRTRNPYRVFVSEVMLQQTQVPRALAKYGQFIRHFPSFRALAEAPLRDVLSEWKGLGYNRRALNLKRAAEIITAEHGGKLPKAPEELVKLPGVGPNTAGSIAAFAFDAPTVFIETNVRSVFIHFFFQDRAGIDDKEILPLIEETLDRKNPREWYYALMDYGNMLKKTANPNIRSRHYARQSPFKGSRREFRAKLLAFVVENPGATPGKAAAATGAALEFAEEILGELAREGFVAKRGKGYRVA